MRVELTQEDIKEGVPMDGNHCAIAVRLRKMRPGEDVCVEVPGVVVGLERYELPPEAEKFAEDFDAGMPVSPIAFNMEPKLVEYPW